MPCPKQVRPPPTCTSSASTRPVAPGSTCAGTRATAPTGAGTTASTAARPARQAAPQPSLGGCDFLEDPALDARSAEPAWLPDPDPLVALAPADIDEADTFSLWSVPGRKSLVHDGRRLLLRTTLGRRAVRLALSLSLGDGMPFAFAVPAGRRGRRGVQAAADLDAALAGSPLRARTPPITRSDLVHMRALQALDAEHDGASEHEIAVLVFGTFDEPESWNDSAIRANVRYLLDHGRRFRDGGYRNLLYPKPQTRKAGSP